MVSFFELTGQKVLESPVEVGLGCKVISALSYVRKKDLLLSGSPSRFSVTNMETFKTVERPRHVFISSF